MQVCQRLSSLECWCQTSAYTTQPLHGPSSWESDRLAQCRW